MREGIRSYGPEDHDDVVELIIQFFNYLAEVARREPWITRQEAMGILNDWLEDNLLFCMEDPEGVVALARLRDDHGVYWVEDLVVREGARRRGLGSRMLAWIEEWVQERGATALFLDIVPSNLASLDFYLAQGYTYLNTIELRKNFYDTPPKKSFSFLGRDLQLHSAPVQNDADAGTTSQQGDALSQKSDTDK